MVLNRSLKLYSWAINSCEEFYNFCQMILKEPKIILDLSQKVEKQ